MLQGHGPTIAEQDKLELGLYKNDHFLSSQSLQQIWMFRICCLEQCNL